MSPSMIEIKVVESSVQSISDLASDQENTIIPSITHSAIITCPLCKYGIKALYKAYKDRNIRWYDNFDRHIFEKHVTQPNPRPNQDEKIRTSRLKRKISPVKIDSIFKVSNNKNLEPNQSLDQNSNLSSSSLSKKCKKKLEIKI